MNTFPILLPLRNIMNMETARYHRMVRVVTHSGLEPVTIKWITLTPGRAVQYNGVLEIARKWTQD